MDSSFYDLLPSTQYIHVYLCTIVHILNVCCHCKSFVSIVHAYIFLPRLFVPAQITWGEQNLVNGVVLFPGCSQVYFTAVEIL